MSFHNMPWENTDIFEGGEVIRTREKGHTFYGVDLVVTEVHEYWIVCTYDRPYDGEQESSRFYCDDDPACTDYYIVGAEEEGGGKQEQSIADVLRR